MRTEATSSQSHDKGWQVNAEKAALRFAPGEYVMWDPNCGAPKDEMESIIENDGSGPFEVLGVRDVPAEILSLYGMHPQDVLVKTPFGEIPINCKWFKKGSESVIPLSQITPEEGGAMPPV